MFRPLSLLVAAVLAGAGAADAADGNVFAISGTTLLFNGQPFKMVGMRLSNGLFSDAETDEVIANLPTFRSYGVNAFSVYMMGSRFGDVKGYRPDATLDPVYAGRLKRLLEAADRQGMVVLVGCLYWSTSRAKEDLGAWTQTQANQAVANTAAFVRGTGRRNVFMDPDNEGMARVATGWSIAQMISAGKNAAPGMIFGYNDKQTPPANCDLTIHFGARVSGKPYVETEGVPSNAPGGYWGSYSRRDGLYNYLNIGVYSDDMKTNQKQLTDQGIAGQGYFLASTWLQCPPPSGPNHVPGGYGSTSDPGVRWWLDHVKATRGAWVPPTPGGGTTPQVQRFMLYDAATDQPLRELTDGAVIDLAATPQVAVVAEATSTAGSVRFTLDGTALVRTENNPPYALFGDTAGDLAPWSPAPGLGVHTITATPASGDDTSGTVGATRTISVTVVQGGATTTRINFQPAAAPTVSGWLVDAGAPYGARGNGLTYGWSRDVASATRDRGVLSDQLSDTLVHTQLTMPAATWEIALANGLYDVRLRAGDPSFINSVYGFTLEGVTALSGTPTSANRFLDTTTRVTVSDGRLSLGNAPGASNNKLCLIEIQAVPSGNN